MKESGYHRQGTAENVFFRLKSLIGDKLRGRRPGGQEAETRLACNIPNRMFGLGRPASASVAIPR